MRKLLESDYLRDPRFRVPAWRREIAARESAFSGRSTLSSRPDDQSGKCREARPPRSTLSNHSEFLPRFDAPTSKHLDGGRSGLAFLSGYAGLAFLYIYSINAVPFQILGLSPDAAIILEFSWALSAPLALVLGLAAAVSIDRAPEKSGRIQALVGFTIGLVGTLSLMFATLFNY